MSFTTLVSDVFRYGCDTSMRSALRSEDYVRIRKALPESEVSRDDDIALVELLGTRLADRAFQNIPWQIRRRMHEWNDGLDAQLRLLNDICRQLSGWRWQLIGQRSYEYNSDNRSVLPAAAGSWQRGRAQPNCLGIAQMTVGVAQAVNAPHYLVNVIHSNQETLLQYKIRTLQLVRSMFGEFPQFGEYEQKVEQARWKALETANRPTQAHHLLVIQLADATWWVVDPYLGALYPLADCKEWEAATTWVAGHHERVALVRPGTPVRTYINGINIHMRALEFACMMFNGRFGPVQVLDDSVINLLSYVAGHAQTSNVTVSDPRGLSLELAALELMVGDETQDTTALEQTATQALVYAAYDIENFSELNATINKSPDQVIAHVGICLVRATEDQAFEKHLSMRIIRFMLKCFMQYLDGLQDDPNTRQHECLEVAWASMGIGIATLNHVQASANFAADARADTLGLTVSLQGKLSTLFSGQWVLYDTLALACEKGESIHPDYLPAIMHNLERVREVPDMMITPLRLLVND